MTRGPFLESPEKFSGPKSQKPRCTELFMSTGFAFKQSLHLCNFSNLRIFLVFQLRTFKVGISGPKTFRGFRETGPRPSNHVPGLSLSFLFSPLMLLPILEPPHLVMTRFLLGQFNNTLLQKKGLVPEYSRAPL